MTTVFFSWQADTPNNIGRNFLKEALEQACKNISKDNEVDEAIRNLSVDSDTSGVAGQPPIVETIFKKIDSSSVYVGDMTFIGKNNNGEPIPNPNVSIEYGWALKSITFERTILVMNVAFGEPSEITLPFNLRHVRWPITYNLSDGAAPEVKVEEKKKLINILEKAIRASIATVPPKTPPVFSEAKTNEPPARFRHRGKEIGIEDDSFGMSEKNKEVFLSEGPAMWLRIMPTKDLTQKLRTHKLLDSAIKFSPGFLPFARHSSGYSYLRAEDGIGSYGVVSGPLNNTESKLTVYSIAFIFETGEIWSTEVNTYIAGRDKIYYSEIENSYINGLDIYTQFLASLGIQGPYKWKAGIDGTKNKKLAYSAPPGKIWIGSGPSCTTNLIEAEGEYSGQESLKSALMPFFKKIFDKCGREFPEHLE